MMIRFHPISFEAVDAAVVTHLNQLPSPVDSFYEEHLLDSIQYEILAGGERIGLTAIHQQKLITQFILFPPFQALGQETFFALKKEDEVRAALVPTCDEFFLSHALDSYQTLKRQAYFFVQRPVSSTADSPYQLRLARAADEPQIVTDSGDFFGDVAEMIEREAIYLVVEEERSVGYGVIEVSALQQQTASIGMFVIDEFRQRGVGTATIRLLQAQCEQLGLRPVAGCWVYNHRSKKTLERGGMVSQTRLLRIEF